MKKAVKKELYGRRRSRPAAISPNEEVDGNQHRFEENIEKEDIRCGKDADHHCLEYEKKNVESLSTPSTAR